MGRQRVLREHNLQPLLEWSELDRERTETLMPAAKYVGMGRQWRLRLYYMCNKSRKGICAGKDWRIIPRSRHFYIELGEKSRCTLMSQAKMYDYDWHRVKGTRPTLGKASKAYPIFHLPSTNENTKNLCV